MPPRRRHPHRLSITVAATKSEAGHVLGLCLGDFLGRLGLCAGPPCHHLIIHGGQVIVGVHLQGSDPLYHHSESSLSNSLSVIFPSNIVSDDDEDVVSRPLVSSSSPVVMYYSY